MSGQVRPRHVDAGATGLGPAQLGTVHFIGIGGAGMSGIARIMLMGGIAVSGSDAKDSQVLRALQALGARTFVGHDAANVREADTVVVSTAIRDANPELVEARDRGLRIIARAQALAAVMLGRRGVAVAGTHGKTSTTSMLVVAAQACGADPSYAVGGELNESGSNAHLGTGDIFVAEADESDGSFLLLSPTAAIVTNVEADHLDNYGDLAAVERAFVDFVGTVRPDGVLVVCRDDERAWSLAEVAAARDLRVRSYGTSTAADLVLTDITVTGTTTSYTAQTSGSGYDVSLGAPGAHMARNSAAALLTGLELGLPAAGLVAGLAGYTGVHRRMELVGVADGVRVFDDYAHHPTEITAQLAAARSVAGAGRVVACFQPHLYSRTAAFAGEFGQALGAADEVVVMDVYAAREDPVAGVNGGLVAGGVPLSAGHVHFEPSWSAAAPLVASLAGPGDLVITLGAGDVTMVAREVVADLAARSDRR